MDYGSVAAQKFNWVFPDGLTRGWKIKKLTERSISISMLPVEVFWRLEGKFPFAVTLAQSECEHLFWLDTAREFIIELRLRKYSLRCCQSPEETTLNVFRHHWDCRYPRALLFSSWRAKVYVCAQVWMRVCVLKPACVYSHVVVCEGLINSQVHGAPSACSAFDRTGAACEGRSWLWGAELSPTMSDKLLIETPVDCLAFAPTVYHAAASWMNGVDVWSLYWLLGWSSAHKPTEHSRSQRTTYRPSVTARGVT